MKTATLRVLIADDEAIARKRLARLVKDIAGVELVGECADGFEVLRRIEEGDVDTVLLDVQMPGLTGLEAMARLPEDGPYVIFCTAYPEHAVHAFDVGAVDYVLKPVEGDRLARALGRARSREAVDRFHAEARRHRAQALERAPPLLRLAIPTKQGIVLLDPRDISHAVLDGELVTIHVGDATYLASDSLQALASRLPLHFERVHRRALLNLEQVACLEPTDTGGYIARTLRGHAVEVSRQGARALRKRLGLQRAADGSDDE